MPESPVLRILFWNVAKQPIVERLARLALQHEPEIMVLAELDRKPDVLAADLEATGCLGFRVPRGPMQKVAVLTRLQPRELLSAYNDADGRLAIWRVRPRRAPEILLAVAHLPSKMNMTDHDQMHDAIGRADAIRQVEADRQHDRTVLVGDLNMNPFDPGVVVARGFHGVMTRDVAARERRTVNGVPFPFFYNPMWAQCGAFLATAPLDHREPITMFHRAP